MKHRYFLQLPDLIVENVDIEDISRSKGYKHTFRAGRGKHGFIYMVRGKMRDEFATEKMDLQAGDLVFIPKNTVYTGTYLEDHTQIKLVQFDIASGSLPPYLSSPIKLEVPRASELIEAFFRPIEDQMNNHPFYYMSCLYRLLWQVDECCYKVPAKYKKLQSALSEISEHYAENRSVSFYADLCDMSEVNFRRLFREYIGMSPIDYRNDIRLNSAKAKLQSGEYNVSEAANLCGFTNLSYFIRLYKKKFGHTPKQE